MSDRGMRSDLNAIGRWHRASQNYFSAVRIICDVTLQSSMTVVFTELIMENENER